MVRDEELNRLIRYAQGMGLSVRFKPYVPHSLTIAEWSTDGTELTVFTTPKDSKIETILSLIHEIGHHKAFIENGRKICPKVEEALGDEERKKSRKVIYDYEVEDTQYWEQIYRDTNCQFKIERLNKQKEFDMWVYEVYYETGKYPTKQKRAEKKRSLRTKYGC